MQDVMRELDNIFGNFAAEHPIEHLTHWHMRAMNLVADVFGDDSHYYQQLAKLTWRAEGIPDENTVGFSSPPKQSEFNERAKLATAHRDARRAQVAAAQALLQGAKASLARSAGRTSPARDRNAPSEQFIPEELWQNTRGYIERVCAQVNKFHAAEIWDGAAVLVRRLVETLIIEAYEHQGREDEIRGSDHNFVMLRDLVARATAESGLGPGRDTKKGLVELKELGDRAAHNRRCNACRADLHRIRAALRVVVDELINLADLRRAP